MKKSNLQSISSYFLGYPAFSTIDASIPYWTPNTSNPMSITPFAFPLAWPQVHSNPGVKHLALTSCTGSNLLALGPLRTTLRPLHTNSSLIQIAQATPRQPLVERRGTPRSSHCLHLPTQCGTCFRRWPHLSSDPHCGQRSWGCSYLEPGRPWHAMHWLLHLLHAHAPWIKLQGMSSSLQLWRLPLQSDSWPMSWEYLPFRGLYTLDSATSL